jgi:hypothetical protein
MDWRAAIIAGLTGGFVFLLLLLVGYVTTTGGTPWTVFRWIGAVVLGEGVLPPPVTFDLGVVLVALLLHFTLSAIYGIVLALIIHRWGVLVGFFGGALFGLALYLINMYAFTTVFDWFYPARYWPFLILHVIFGAVAGTVYELLERDFYALDVDVEEGLSL